MRDLLFGTLGGLVVGGAAVLLTTPRSGAENRRRFKNYARDVKSSSTEAKEKLSYTQSKVKEVQFELDKVKGPFINEIKGTLSDFQLEAQPRIRRIKENQAALQAEINDLNSRLN